MAEDRDLASAKKQKKDEFYTQLSDIEKEMRYYKKHFRGKTVFLNCDDPFESKFFEYFVKKFNSFGLKKLIATCYAGSPIMGDQLSLFDINPETTPGTPYKAVVTKVYDKTGDGYIDMLDIKELFKSGENELTELEGNGDYRSTECIELLKEADIVVTNPPFSKFRDYVALLMEYGKDFIIIGNMNAVAYKEVFPLIKDNKVWLGASIHSGDRAFYVPDDYPLEAAGCGIDEETGRKFIRVKGVRWFTTLDHRQRHEGLDLYKRYDPELYPRYDNFDAINVDVTREIPCDYDGLMGVPITFIDKYSPDQFEIIGLAITDLGKSIGVGDYDRKYKTPASRDGTVYYVKDGKGVVPYARVIIKNKHPEEPRK
ncbi:adenine-specific methyltransferase EcoRI family protein [Anaerotardibacter muris]|uniref:adenine-specific methyltransferase EcoRI family protein n=1 Tax=Anaerotardibacter muris TaxID=2941505 RepID=UPI0020421478|nr:adenine-specific methyltransferase EcoRI family protein [Anaerotardibacter muris]